MNTKKGTGVFPGITHEGVDYLIMYLFEGYTPNKEKIRRLIEENTEGKTIWYIEKFTAVDELPIGLYALVQNHHNIPHFEKDLISELEPLCKEVTCYDTTEKD